MDWSFKTWREERKRKKSEIPPATGMLAALAMGLCVFGLWFSRALVTTEPIVLFYLYTLPLAALACGLGGVFLGSERALRFTRFGTGLLVVALVFPLGNIALFSDDPLDRMGAATGFLYIFSVHLGLRGDPRMVLGPPVERAQLPRRIIAVAIVVTAFSAASFIWAKRNGIELF